MFRYSETWKYQQKILILPPSLIIRFFSIPQNFWNTEGFFNKKIGTMRQIIFYGKSRQSLSWIKTIGARKFWIKKGPLQSCSVLWGKKKINKNPMAPLIQKISQFKKLSETQGPPIKLFGTVRRKLSGEIPDTFPRFELNFSIPEFFNNIERSPH